MIDVLQAPWKGDAVRAIWKGVMKRAAALFPRSRPRRVLAAVAAIEDAGPFPVERVRARVGRAMKGGLSLARLRRLLELLPALALAGVVAGCGSKSSAPPTRSSQAPPSTSVATASTTGVTSSQTESTSGSTGFGAGVDVTDKSGFQWRVSAAPVQTATTLTDATVPGQPQSVAQPRHEFVTVQVRWTNTANQVEGFPEAPEEFAVSARKYGKFIEGYKPASILGPCDSTQLPKGICRLETRTISDEPAPPAVGDLQIQPGGSETFVEAIASSQMPHAVPRSAPLGDLELFLDLADRDVQVPIPGT